MDLKQIKKLLSTLDFTLQEGTKGIFQKKYTQFNNYFIVVDCDNQTINYSDKIKCGSKRTLNFAKDENFVVLECVDRLLTKGYKPENIEIEKIWPAGHGHFGELDICVYNDEKERKEYLLIECKTYGAEFEKELTKIQKDGGQLFTYFKFSNEADLLMLYASQLSNNEFIYRNEIVRIEEEYRTGDVYDFYDKWNKLTKNNGIFENERKPYQYKTKALRHCDLEEIRLKDSNFIFIQFLEILRHNVVSDKPNAFNKIFTLFLCKIYDEKERETNNDDLHFQWREDDDHVKFQLRLTELYKNGMKEFLEKSVSDFSEEEFDKKYHQLLHHDNHLGKELKDEINRLRLEKNNEFAIKEVFDKRSFEENAVVVKAVVQLLEKFKVRYCQRQQYLSDFFELLLTTGLKQEAGQFFTPVPIAQFIIKSLPIDKIVKEKLLKGQRDDLLPYIMDFAAGSGHFLTESMHLIQELLKRMNLTDLKVDARRSVQKWLTDPFDWAFTYIYGVEKDYRLVKVGKVGCYLHGDGLANVIHSDGLAKFGHEDYKEKLKTTDKDFSLDNRQFDVVVSNPPYSVSTFKNAAKYYYGKEDFELYDKLTDSSSEIECLFIERTKQLLKDGGVAGIILPSSILSNAGIYAKAREMILRYFDIIAITELGSGTFMATGTNTVVLFLRRRNNYDSRNFEYAVDKFFRDFQDVTINGIETPVAEYLNYVWNGIQWDDYLSLLKKSPNKSIQKHDLYKEYEAKIKTNNEAEFLGRVLALEKEKIFYFILAWPQKVVIVKSGGKDDEKRFLGYEFSFRRGNEGIHPIQRGKMIDECTQLFDPDIETFENKEKASTYIYRTFTNPNAELNLPENLKNHVFKMDLVDMLTFDWATVETRISLAVKKKVTQLVCNKFELVSLEKVADVVKGTSITKATTVAGDVPVVAGGLSIAYYHNVHNRQGNIITVSASGANAGFVNYYRVPIFASDCNTIQSKDEKVLLTRLIYYFLSSIQDDIYELGRGQAQPHVYKKDLDVLKIPLPPLDVQTKIVKEMEMLEKKEAEVKTKKESLSGQFEKILESLDFPAVQLGSIVSLKNGLNYSRKSLGDTINIIGVGDFQNNIVPDLSSLEQIQIDGKLPDDYILNSDDLLIVRSNGSASLVGRILLIDKVLPNTSFSGFTIRLRPNFEKVNSKFLCYYLRTQKVREKLTTDSSGSNIKSINQTLLSSLTVPLPSLSEQRKLVAKIEKLENEISNLHQKLQSFTEQKNAVLKKWL